MTEEIRRLERSEIETLVAWAGREGWNPGFSDAVPFQAADPNGFFGLFVDGRLASGISAVAYDDDFGFIGLYITDPDMRGKGYGRRIWDHAMAYLGKRTIGLDGVPEQQENYARMGFVSNYGTARWSGSLAAENLPPPSATRNFDSSELETIAAFDRAFFPAGRARFLAEWINAAASARLIEKDGTTTGYAVARKCLKGYKIGPVFAKTPQCAKALLSGIVDDIGTAHIDIDVPLSQLSFITFLEAVGMERGFETARMYRGKAPALHIAGVFAVTSLELG